MVARIRTWRQARPPACAMLLAPLKTVQVMRLKSFMTWRGAASAGSSKLLLAPTRRALDPGALTLSV